MPDIPDFEVKIEKYLAGHPLIDTLFEFLKDNLKLEEEFQPYRDQLFTLTLTNPNTGEKANLGSVNID